jgi:hypothetical protein
MFRKICKLCCWNPELSKRNQFLCSFVIKVYIVHTNLENVFPIQFSISFKSHTDKYFVLISGEEKVVITFESRRLHGKLPSKLLFTYAVLNKIRLSSLTCGIVHINNRVIYVTNKC